jgi:hypothetical protein
MNKDTNDPIAGGHGDSGEPLRAAIPDEEVADVDLSGEEHSEGERGGSTSKPQTKPQPALIGLLVLLLVAGLSLFAYGALNKGDQKGGGVITIPTAFLTPIAQLDPKLASVLTELQAIYIRQGIDKAREFAVQTQLMDDKEVIRLAMDLDTEDPAEQEEVVRQLEAWHVTIYNRYKNTFNISFTLTQAGQELGIPTAGPGTPVTIPTALVGGQLPPTILSGMAKLKRVVRVYQPLPYTTPNDVSFDNLYQIRPEGLDKLHAEDWHRAGFTGKGMKIGVLDPEGFTGYRDMLGQELPQNVTVQAFNLDNNIEGDQARAPINRSHGTACAEIVHAMAPDAELYLAIFDGTGQVAGSEERAANWLVEQGVTIISASYGSHGSARDGKTSPSTQLVDALSQKGILWAVSSGNEADDHYRGTFKAGPDGVSNIFYNGTAQFSIKIEQSAPGTILLQWDDWEARNIDLSLILLAGDGSRIFGSTDVQDGSAASRPVEGIRFSDKLTPGTYYLAIASTKPVTRPLTFDLWNLKGPASFEKTVAEASLGTPADARGAFTVGAVNWDSEQVTTYSSQGPTDDGRIKPDITAPSDVKNRTFGTFSGTSASAPFVAGAAALIWSTNRNLTSEQIKQALIQRAKDTGAPGPDPVYGVGKLDMGPLPNGQLDVPTPGPTPGTVPTPVPIPGGTTSTGGSDNGMLWVMVLGGALVALSLVAGIGIWLLTRRKAQAQPAYAMPGQYPGQPPQYPQYPQQYPPQQYPPGQYPGQPPPPPQPPQYGGVYQQQQPGQYPGQAPVPPQMPQMPGYVPPPMAQGPGPGQPMPPGPPPPQPGAPQPPMPGGPGGMAPPPPAQGGFPPPPPGSPPQVPGQGPMPGSGGRPAPPPPRQAMPCPNCGRPLKPGAAQCDNCGWKKS